MPGQLQAKDRTRVYVISVGFARHVFFVVCLLLLGLVMQKCQDMYLESISSILLFSYRPIALAHEVLVVPGPVERRASMSPHWRPFQRPPRLKLSRASTAPLWIGPPVGISKIIPRSADNEKEFGHSRCQQYQ